MRFAIPRHDLIIALQTPRSRSCICFTSSVFYTAENNGKYFSRREMWRALERRVFNAHLV